MDKNLAIKLGINVSLYQALLETYGESDALTEKRAQGQKFMSFASEIDAAFDEHWEAAGGIQENLFKLMDLLLEENYTLLESAFPTGEDAAE